MVTLILLYDKPTGDRRKIFIFVETRELLISIFGRDRTYIGKNIRSFSKVALIEISQRGSCWSVISLAKKPLGQVI